MAKEIKRIYESNLFQSVSRTSYARPNEDSNNALQGVKAAQEKISALSAQTQLAGDSKVQFKLSPDEKKKLLSIPPEDLFLILDCQSIISESIFDTIYDWLKLQDKNFKLSKIDFKTYCRKTSPEEYLNIIELCLNDQGKGVLQDFRKRLNIILSDKFKNEYNQFLEFLSPPKNNPNYFEIFKIFFDNDSNFERNKYLNPMKTQDFKNFCAEIKKDYDIDFFRDLKSALELYIEPKKNII